MVADKLTYKINYKNRFMHIAFCLDNNYVQYCSVVIASIIYNNVDEEITFHLLSNDITDKNKLIIEKWLASYKNKSIFFYKIDNSKFIDFSIEESSYLNISTYYRLAMPYLLADIKKVLYLDCDIIVNQSLKDLWSIDISNYACAGVRDRINDSIRLYNRLNYAMSDGYVNAGVLLINLERWRYDDIFEKSINIVKTESNILKNHDQDLINKIYHGQIKMLPFKYNLLEYYLYTEDWLYMEKKYYPDLIKACKAPVIIHFCMPQKPWHIECINPYKELYYKYRKMTPWPKLKLIHKKEKLSKKQKLKLFLGKLGLYKVERKSTLRKDINVIEDQENILF